MLSDSQPSCHFNIIDNLLLYVNEMPVNMGAHDGRKIKAYSMREYAEGSEEPIWNYSKHEGRCRAYSLQVIRNEISNHQSICHHLDGGVSYLMVTDILAIWLSLEHSSLIVVLCSAAILPFAVMPVNKPARYTESGWCYHGRIALLPCLILICSHHCRTSIE